MKTLDTKKIIIVFSVIIAIVLTAVLLAITTGNVHVPSLSDPNGVFYQRTDDDGNVIYTLTNEDLFEQIKANDGMKQLLLMTDQTILADYINKVTAEEVANKIKELKYGTSDPDEIAKIDPETQQQDEDNYQQAIAIAGYQNNENEYAKILVARQKFAEDAIKNGDEITGYDIGQEFVNNYFDDIQAIKIRFTSAADAANVMQKFNLVTVNNDYLGQYNGFVFNDEELNDPNGNIVQAYQAKNAYYFDEDSNLLDIKSVIAYTKTDDGYLGQDGKDYHLDQTTGDLIADEDSSIAVPNTQIFNNLDDAKTYQEANTTYYKVSKVDINDPASDLQILDMSDNLVYTIDIQGRTFNTDGVDVSLTTNVIVNKEYKKIEDVDSFTENDVAKLTDQEMLNKYIEMYNYVYGEYRDTLKEGSTKAQLISSDNDDLKYTFDDVAANNSALATYMFYTLSANNDKYYSIAPQEMQAGNQDNYYMVYKLTSPEKFDLVDTIASYIEPTIVIPTKVGGTLTLPTTSYYDSTITWSSSDPDIISNVGIFARPETDTDVDLTYTLTIFGKTVSNTITVTALASGDTVAVDEKDWTEIPVKTLINNDTVYNAVLDKIVQDKVYGSNGSANVTNELVKMRQDLGFKINDLYLSYNYQSTDKDYKFTGRGDKSILASFDKTLTSDEPYQVTADDYFKFFINKNAGLYTVYAAQYKELLNSSYFEQIFGDQTNIKRNHTLHMEKMLDQVQSTKNYYVYLQNLYSQYGMTFNYDSYEQYAYTTYKTKSDYELLQHFVTGELQPFIIEKVINDYDILNKIYPTVEEYYNNYFSLNVTHVLVYLDRDEDGSPDNYNDFFASLNDTDKATYEQKLADLEDAIINYSSSFSDLVTEYNNATRDDATWGDFKQMGFMILTESLNVPDSQDQNTTHSLTYVGDYGVKDTYAQPFIDTLIKLYDLYQLPQNIDSSKLDAGSDSISITKFGIHKIDVTKGDDFTKPSCKFTEADSSNPLYADGIENSSDMPSMSQIEVYMEYKMLSLLYDLTDSEVESKYDITIPQIPASVKTALDTYVGVIFDKIFVIGPVNVGMADILQSGDFVSDNNYSTLTNDQIMSMINTVHDVYYHAIFDPYIPES